jgi:hypothetical protein
MRRRIMYVVGVVCCGLMGALLWAGPAGAQPFYGCLLKCVACNANPAACQAVFPGDGVTGPTLSYQDNGDGTITDLNTKLMWEKKVVGNGTCLGALHAVGAGCTWSDATGAWMSAVNAEGGTGYAGHNDWRFPNVRELMSIVDYGLSDPAIDPMFGPTAASFYWSSTSVATFPSLAWFVNFAFGEVGINDKIITLRVRAVRGGR